MRKYLLPAEGAFYKANLHAHSILSDGHMTSAEMKRAYQAEGYSVLAVTDHELCFEHTELNDADFVMLTGYELAFNEVLDKPFDHVRTCHVNLFAREPLNTVQVAFDPSQIWCGPEGAAARVQYVGEKCQRVYSAECVDHAVSEALKNGCIAQLNHPAWSMESPAHLLKYRGFFAMEIYNHGCFVEGINEYNEAVYDLMLRNGQRMALTATDDNHNCLPLDHPRSDSFGGFTMIKAPSLTYRAIFEALERGDFYASTGPVIYELYAEDDALHIVCSPAATIDLTTYGRRSARVTGASEAIFPLNGYDGYVRVTVTDDKGRKAFTRAYFASELVWTNTRCAFDGTPFRGEDVRA